MNVIININKINKIILKILENISLDAILET